MYKLLLVILFSISVCNGQSNWALEKQSGGIKVYLRKTDHSTIKEFKAVTRIKTSLNDLVTLLTNGDRLKEWNYRTNESKLIAKPSDSVSYVYMYNDFTWPVLNRDHVSKLTVNWIARNVCKIDISSAFNKVPKKSGVIRIKKFYGYWLLKKQGSYIEITYQMYGDPEGYIPTFMINKTLVKAPLHNLRKLKELLEK